MPFKKDQQINFLNQHFKLILFLTMVIIFGLAYWLSWSSLIKQYQSLSKQVIKEKKENLEKQKGNFNQLSEMNEIYNHVNPDLKNKITQLLPSGPNLPDLYCNLNTLASTTGYQILSIEVEFPKEEKAPESINNSSTPAETNSYSSQETEELFKTEKKLKEIKINLALQGGGYLSLKKFLDLIEHNLRMIDIELLNYDPKKMVVDIRMKTYYLE